MKTVVGRVMHGTNETEDGQEIDVIFGYQSVSNRIVESCMVQGTTTTLLKLISKEIVDMYRAKYPMK